MTGLEPTGAETGAVMLTGAAAEIDAAGGASTKGAGLT